MLYNDGFDFDVARGVDVMRGKRVVRHFEGPLAYHYATLEVAGRPGYYLRFWGRKPA